MSQRRYSLADRFIGELDTALRVVFAKPQAAEPSPGQAVIQADPDALKPAEKSLGSRLMRVNHAGETAAQALYRGQALVARDAELRADLLQAAAEEQDHLAWCQQRAEQLGGGVSKLAPLWYSGSFAIGVLAGLYGDKISLGFLAETEQQVSEHLEGHLQRLPERDRGSRAIVEKMRADEIRHGEGALERGGEALPAWSRSLMRLVARFMTEVSFRV
ncbi:MAG: 2-polyprenyl-3-methyl-6-methoxy-1,4-benzoquinone monooxygenase [Gammaproteobacteria bacterium]|jgi:ubiquinone biosynthesis monooxygenase Coq7